MDKNGESALFKACCVGASKDIISTLLDHGAEINMQDNKGQSALMKLAPGGEPGAPFAFKDSMIH